MTLDRVEKEFFPAYNLYVIIGGFVSEKQIDYEENVVRDIIAEVGGTFLSEDHKPEVLEALALKVLRGDEELGSALRLKAEELQRHLLCHMTWEEDQLVPLLVEDAPAAADPPPWVQLLRERRQQRLQLSRSLFELKYSHVPAGDLAKQCLALIEALEAAIEVEEHDVLPSILHVELAGEGADHRSVRREAVRDRTPR